MVEMNPEKRLTVQEALIEATNLQKKYHLDILITD